MIMCLAQKLYDRVFGDIDRHLDIRKDYENVKNEYEDILELKQHPQWNKYENILVRKLLAGHDGMKESVAKGDLSKASFYCGIITCIENIIQAPKVLKEQEKNLFDQLKDA